MIFIFWFRVVSYYISLPWNSTFGNNWRPRQTGRRCCMDGRTSYYTSVTSPTPVFFAEPDFPPRWAPLSDAGHEHDDHWWWCYHISHNTYVYTSYEYVAHLSEIKPRGHKKKKAKQRPDAKKQAQDSTCTAVSAWPSHSISSFSRKSSLRSHKNITSRNMSWWKKNKRRNTTCTVVPVCMIWSHICSFFFRKSSSWSQNKNKLKKKARWNKNKRKKKKNTRTVVPVYTRDVFTPAHFPVV